MSDDTFSLVVLGALVLIIFLLCAWAIKKFFRDKKYWGGAEFFGREVYKEFQNADRRDQIEHIIYMEEEKKEDFKAGDGPKKSSQNWEDETS